MPTAKPEKTPQVIFTNLGKWLVFPFMALMAMTWTGAYICAIFFDHPKMHYPILFLSNSIDRYPSRLFGIFGLGTTVACFLLIVICRFCLVVKHIFSHQQLQGASGSRDFGDLDVADSMYRGGLNPSSNFDLSHIDSMQVDEILAINDRPLISICCGCFLLSAAKLNNFALFLGFCACVGAIGVAASPVHFNKPLHFVFAGIFFFTGFMYFWTQFRLDTGLSDVRFNIKTFLCGFCDSNSYVFNTRVTKSQIRWFRVRYSLLVLPMFGIVVWIVLAGVLQFPRSTDLFIASIFEIFLFSTFMFHVGYLFHDLQRHRFHVEVSEK